MLAIAGCASASGPSSLPISVLEATGAGMHADVVQRGNGAAQGYTFKLPPAGDDPRSGIVRGYDDNMWFGTFEQIGRISERGKIALFTQETAYPYLSGGVSRGPTGDRHLWYTVEQASGGESAVAIVTTPSGEMTERAMPGNITVLWGIAAGPDKAMYAASYGSNLIVRIPVNGPTTAYDLPGPVPGRPLNIVLGPDGAMWFTMVGASSIGRFDTETHAISYYPIATPDAGPIVSFGGAIYFLAGYDRDNDYVGKMSTTGAFTQLALPAWNNKSRIEALCVGPDGNLWVGGFGSLWSISTADAVSGPTQLPGIARGPNYLAAGADGNLWSLNDEPASISVYLLHALTVSSTRFDLTLGQSVPLTVSEKTPSGKLEARSLAKNIASVSSAMPGSFTIHAVGLGSTTVHVKDGTSNFIDIPVTVSP